jgi:hypothetical protein
MTLLSLLLILSTTIVCGFKLNYLVVTLGLLMLATILKRRYLYESN